DSAFRKGRPIRRQARASDSQLESQGFTTERQRRGPPLLGTVAETRRRKGQSRALAALGGAPKGAIDWPFGGAHGPSFQTMAALTPPPGSSDFRRPSRRSRMGLTEVF